ncbi:cytochrome p450 domain-containing protein [Phthorimaea operculella]|nr:cytochrome p450 domain-containing protein [Phthorimaea operculella]
MIADWVAILLLCYFMFYVWQRYRAAYKDAPKTVPVWACLKILLNGKDLWDKMLEVCTLVHERGGVAVGTYYVRGLQPIYVVSDPEDSMTALKACAEKAPMYQLWKPWLGVAAFIGNIQTNKLHRKFFMKSLTPTSMDAFLTHFNIHSERLIQKLSKYADTGPFDVIRILRMYNLELLCDTMLAFKNLESVDFEAYLVSTRCPPTSGLLAPGLKA